MNCRLCRSTDLTPLPFDIPLTAGRWFRCQNCGSDSADHDYPDDFYTREYEENEVDNSGGVEVRNESIRSNLDWFGPHHELGDERTFLDVGCCDGAALRGMQDRGWGVHGFDVFEPSYFASHVTVAPYFHRWLFPRRYAAVLCREVLEHVESPNLLLHELHGVTLPGGLVQIQTPRPWFEYHPIPYQRAHLFLISPFKLQSMIQEAMLDLIEAREWEMGQAYLCRARR